MDNVRKELIDRYEEFWLCIYNNEKEEIRRLKEYIDYVEKSLREYNVLDNSYNSFKSLFMNKHLDYLQEAFYSLVLGNYNSCICLIRIIIENYITFLLIKKYRKAELWKDWYIFGYKKYIKMVDKEPYHLKILNSYDSICKNLNFNSSIFNNSEPYAWLERVVKLKRYNIGKICNSPKCNIKEGKKIYKDFEYFSSYIHNNDVVAKTNWIDMKLLSSLLFAMYNYTDKIIKEYDGRYLRRIQYTYLKYNLLESLDECINYSESK